MTFNRSWARMLIGRDEKPTVPEVVELVAAYYGKSGNSVGGSLHIVLEDGNVETGHVEFCRREAIEQNDHDGELLADVLLRMSKTQRSKLAAATQNQGEGE